MRERYAYLRPWARFLVEPAEAVSFMMTQRMLRGIRDRAERIASKAALTQLKTITADAGSGASR